MKEQKEMHLERERGRKRGSRGQAVCSVGGRQLLQSTRLETMQTQRKQSAKANSTS